MKGQVIIIVVFCKINFIKGKMVFRKISMRQMVSLDRMLDQIAFIASIEINFNCGIENAFIG